MKNFIRNIILVRKLRKAAKKSVFLKEYLITSPSGLEWCTSRPPKKGQFKNL